MPAVPEGVAVAGANLVQASYALLYGMPAICLGAVYAAGQRAQAGRFLFTLFLGTFSAYALLPHFPVRAPRFAFPSQLTPGAITIFGTWNIWVLDHFDIATSVFPSGHVAVAFSSAFGLLRALPKRRAVWMAAFGVAGCVWAATIYSRFHYTADGAASFLISIAAWQVSGRWDGCGSDA
jgi:membrane-associated phospholipid phosphatase